jgi:hypothetical protein
MGVESNELEVRTPGELLDDTQMRFVLGGPSPTDTGDTDSGHPMTHEQTRDALCGTLDSTFVTLVPS